MSGCFFAIYRLSLYSVFNENYESHNPFTFFTNTKEKALEPQESEPQNITIPQHSSSTNNSPNFDNNTDNKICIRKKDLYHPVKKRKSSITQEKEILLKKFEGEFTIKELSDKLNLPASSLYYWAKKIIIRQKMEIRTHPFPMN